MSDAEFNASLAETIDQLGADSAVAQYRRLRNDMALQLFGYRSHDEIKSMSIRRFFAGGEVPAGVSRMFRNVHKGTTPQEEQDPAEAGYLT